MALSKPKRRYAPDFCIFKSRQVKQESGYPELLQALIPEKATFLGLRTHVMEKALQFFEIKPNDFRNHSNQQRCIRHHLAQLDI